jgi:dipeptidyl aminopeptidase/acylaminoacyl peptidase
MRRLNLALTSVLAVAALGLLRPVTLPAAAELTAKRPIALEDLHAIKAVSSLAVSPDGRHAVYVVRETDRERDRRMASLWRVPVEGGAPQRLAHDATSLSSPAFSPDGRHLAFVASRDTAPFGLPRSVGDRGQVFVLPLDGGEAFPVTSMKGGVSDFEWAPDSRRLVVVSRDPRPDTNGEDATAPPIVVTRLQHKRDGTGFLDNRRGHLYLVNLDEPLASAGSRHGEPRALTEGRYDHSAPAWSPDGRLIAFSSNRTEEPDDNGNTDVWTIDVETGAIAQVTTDPGSDGRPVWSPDGKWIAYVHGPDDPPVYAVSRLKVIPASGGTPRSVTGALDRHVAGRPIWAPDGRSLYLAISDEGRTPLVRMTLDGRRTTVIEDGVGDFSLAGARDDRIVVLLSTPSRAAEVYTVPVAGGRGGTPLDLSRVNAELFETLDFNEPEEIRYRSADGTPVHGWILKPPDFDASRKYPLLLRIHGGPVAQYTASFSFEHQYLASLGYVVLFTNPRGSSGYGEAFSKAIFADWGNRDYEDVMAGVDHVIDRGYVDPQKLGVGGWSYGGILTNYVITKTTRFAAAISCAGSSDMFSSFGVDDVRLWWLRELGPPWENVELYRRLSPIMDVAKVETPTLFVVGEQDFRVPLQQSEQFYLALRTLGRETGLIVYPGQAHGITKPSYQTDRLRRYTYWYDRHLRGMDVDPLYEIWKPPQRQVPTP